MTKLEAVRMLPTIQDYIENDCSRRFIINVLQAMAQEIADDITNNKEW